MCVWLKMCSRRVSVKYYTAILNPLAFFIVYKHERSTMSLKLDIAACNVDTAPTQRLFTCWLAYFALFWSRMNLHGSKYIFETHIESENIYSRIRNWSLHYVWSQRKEVMCICVFMCFNEEKQKFLLTLSAVVFLFD